MQLQLDRRKPFTPSINPGAYPLGMIGAYILGETGAASAIANNIKFYDAVSRQRVQFQYNGAPLNLRQVQNGGGFAAYNTSANDWGIFSATRAYDPKTWVIWGGVPATKAGGLLGKNDGNSVNAGWLHSIDSSAGVEFNIEYTTTNLKVRAAPAGHGSWADCIHCLAFSWDGSQTAANQKVYIDGIPQAHSLDTNGVGTHASDGANVLKVTQGTFAQGFGAFGDSIVESFFFFNRVLSPAEIQELYIYPYRYTTGNVDRMLRGAAHIYTQSFNASMSTFSATLTMTLTHAKLVALAAVMVQMAGSLTKRIGKALSAGMATFSATLTTLKIKAGSLQVFNASMSTFSATLTKLPGKVFNAQMKPFSGSLSLAVTHGSTPPTCIPVGCDTLPQVTSHVEQCENPGS